ncbi:MAG: hypothetical protein M4579_003990 [Chaenotheca gracillima]|nr:MAG: hypothetical protein M4579_003990 [Chaenotheca gracillima]
MGLAHLPPELLLQIFSQCTPDALDFVSRTCPFFERFVTEHAVALCRQILDVLYSNSAFDPQTKASLARQSVWHPALSPIQELQMLWYRVCAVQDILDDVALKEAALQKIGEVLCDEERTVRELIPYGFCLMWEFKDAIDSAKSGGAKGTKTNPTEDFVKSLAGAELDVLYLAAGLSAALLLKASQGHSSKAEYSDTPLNPPGPEHYVLIEVALTKGIGYVHATIQNCPDMSNEMALLDYGWGSFLRKGNQNTKLLQGARAKREAEQRQRESEDVLPSG